MSSSQQQPPAIILAADPLGDTLRAALARHLQANCPGWRVVDLGVFPKYWEAAFKAAGSVQASVASGGRDRALLCCGTGIGMSIIANKHPDVWCALVGSAQAAKNAAAINNANVLAFGGTVIKEADALAAVDAWLATPFKDGYKEYEALLDASMSEIPAMVHGGSAAAAAPYPTAALFVEGRAAAGWQPIGAMGHDACVMCLLREDACKLAAAQGSASSDSASSSGSGGGTRVRALVRFPAGAREPPHHHSHGHDVLVLSGDKTVTTHAADGADVTHRQRLRALDYFYTPAGVVHSVEYHADTLFLLGFDGPLDLLWDGDETGVQWATDAARAAAEAELPWTPPQAL